MEKTCRRCKKTQDLEKEFSPHLYTTDGYSHICKECIRTQNKENYEKNKEKRKLQMRAYNNRTKEVRNQISSDWYYANIERAAAKQKARYHRMKASNG